MSDTDRAPATADHRRTCWCGHRWRDHGPAHGTTDVFGGKCLAWVDDPDASSLTLCTCRAWHTHERLGAGSAEYRRGWRDAIEAEAADGQAASDAEVIVLLRARIEELEAAARPEAAALDVERLAEAMDNLFRERYGVSALPPGSTTIGGAYAADIAAEYARLPAAPVEARLPIEPPCKPGCCNHGERPHIHTSLYAATEGDDR